MINYNICEEIIDVTQSPFGPGKALPLTPEFTGRPTVYIAIIGFHANASSREPEVILMCSIKCNHMINSNTVILDLLVYHTS